MTELLGDTANVYAFIGDHNIILKVEPYEIPKVGSRFKFSVPYESIYFFDRETGKTLNL